MILPKHLEAVTGLVNHRRARIFRKVQTHCKRGHPLSGYNLKIGAAGRRVCGTCNAQKTKESNERARQSFYAQGLTWEGKARKTRRKPPIATRLIPSALPAVLP